MKQEKKAGSGYYWIIVGAVFVLMAMTVGFPVNCFSVFAPAWVAYFQCPTATIQLVNMIATLGNAVSCLFLARVLKKLGFRKAIAIYSVIALLGLFGRSTANSIPTLICWNVVQAIGLSGCSTIPCSMLINTWFVKDRGTATGIAFTGSVVGGLILVQLSKIWVASVGWQRANLYLCIIAAVCMLPITFWLAVEKPSDKGMFPKGVTEESLKLGGAARPVATGITKKAFTKTSVFWLLAFVFFCIGFCNLGMQNNMTLALIYQHGFTAVQAANIFSINMFIQIFGKILLGKIYDKAGIKVASIYTLILYVLCTVTMILCTGNITIGLVFGGLFGLMSSATTVAPPYILGSAVGTREYSAIYGVLNLIFVAGCAIGPIVASSVYDKTGTFNMIFIVFTVFAVLSGICTIIAAKKAHDNGFAKMTD